MSVGFFRNLKIFWIIISLVALIFIIIGYFFTDDKLLTTIGITVTFVLPISTIAVMQYFSNVESEKKNVEKLMLKDIDTRSKMIANSLIDKVFITFDDPDVFESEVISEFKKKYFLGSSNYLDFSVLDIKKIILENNESCFIIDTFKFNELLEYFHNISKQVVYLYSTSVSDEYKKRYKLFLEELGFDMECFNADCKLKIQFSKNIFSQYYESKNYSSINNNNNSKKLIFSQNYPLNKKEFGELNVNYRVYKKYCYDYKEQDKFDDYFQIKEFKMLMKEYKLKLKNYNKN